MKRAKGNGDKGGRRVTTTATKIAIATAMRVPGAGESNGEREE
jgi:hypothetical protein